MQNVSKKTLTVHKCEPKHEYDTYEYDTLRVVQIVDTPREWMDRYRWIDLEVRACVRACLSVGILNGRYHAGCTWSSLKIVDLKFDSSQINKSSVTYGSDIVCGGGSSTSITTTWEF